MPDAGGVMTSPGPGVVEWARVGSIGGKLWG